jgi:hypothetical protein
MSALTDNPAYQAQINEITAAIRAGFEARVAQGWREDLAFDEAAALAARCGQSDEATILMMTLATSALAEGWDHSEALVTWWNARFPTAHRTSGFATPAIVNTPIGKAMIAATWSGFLENLGPRADA